YLDFLRGETMKALDPFVKQAIAMGRLTTFNNPARERLFLKSVSTDDLLKLKPGPGVYRELLVRKGVRDDDRQKALPGLGKLENRSGPHVLLETVRGLDEQAGDQDEGVVFDLIRIGTDRGAGELVGMRADLEKLATSAKRPVTRQLGFVALIAADGNAEKA